MIGSREIAVRILCETDEEGKFAGRILHQLLAKSDLDGRDKRLVCQLVYGVIRRKNTLDWIIEKFSSKKNAFFGLSNRIKNILRLGIYQLVFLEKIPAYAVVNESVELAKIGGKKSQAGFVNGILREFERNISNLKFPEIEADPIEHISITYSHPEWLVKKWVDEFGFDETVALCKVNNSVPPIVLRINELKVTVKECLDMLRDEGIDYRKSRFFDYVVIVKAVEGEVSRLYELDIFKKGYFILQDEASLFASVALDPVKGEKVLDLCASPGGKSTHLAQLMDNEGDIISVDISKEKLALIEENIERLGVNIIETIKGDVKNLKGFWKGEVDKILLDVPCSNTGVLRRRIEAKWRLKEKDLKAFQNNQLAMLNSASDFVKYGGVIVYSTCSITKEEGEEVIEKFLSKKGGFEVEPIDGFKDKEIVTKDGFLRTYPHKDGIDGVFVAKIRRRRECL